MSAPQQIGPYRVIRELARGGMGVVYEAEHAATGARCAVKTILPSVAGPEELVRFQREVETVGDWQPPCPLTICPGSLGFRHRSIRCRKGCRYYVQDRTNVLL